MSFYNCSDFPFNFNLIVNLKAADLSGEANLLFKKNNNAMFVVEGPASTSR